MSAALAESSPTPFPTPGGCFLQSSRNIPELLPPHRQSGKLQKKIRNNLSLIIATGSNLGDRLKHLERAASALSECFQLLAESRVYLSKAVGYLDQPDFFNQVLEFQLPEQWTPEQVMQKLLELEKEQGRVRDIPRGPRTIDLDLLFWADAKLDLPQLKIPHPRLFERSFVVRPLRELPYFRHLQNKYHFAESFSVEAFPL